MEEKAKEWEKEAREREDEKKFKKTISGKRAIRTTPGEAGFIEEDDDENLDKLEKEIKELDKQEKLEKKKRKKEKKDKKAKKKNRLKRNHDDMEEESKEAMATIGEAPSAEGLLPEKVNEEE